ncbi:hypothetical protein BBJ28_00023086 [Nothophytophthora sp. Chile5]|nr:hypothetical protein BBJ28_00023086 [Nothophytophthora sp. Chile5]
MLGDFVQLEAEELKKKESDAKKKKKAEDENSIGGKRIRDAAVAGMESFTGQKRHKSAADAMADAIKDVSATHAELRTKEIETQMKMQADNLFVQQQMLQNSEHMQAQMASINASMQATQQETMQMMREMIAMMRRN